MKEMLILKYVAYEEKIIIANLSPTKTLEM